MELRTRCLFLLAAAAAAISPQKSNAQDPVVTTDISIEVEADTAASGHSEYITGSAEDSLPAIDKMPEVLYKSQPSYPPELARMGIEGSVVLDCILSDSGTVDSVAVIKGLHPQLDSSAAEALRKFRFTPAFAGGTPVPVLLQYEFPFTLTEVASKVEKYVNFSGVLRECGTRSPIADAMVVITFPDSASDTALDIPFDKYIEKIGSFDGQYLEGRSIVTVTDSSGKFRFHSLPACSITVTSPLPGYEAFVQKELILPGEELSANYYVRKVSYNDYEIVVYGKQEEKEITHRQLTLNEIRKIPGLGNDAVRVVQTLPGVSRPSFGSGDVIVRGAPTWDSEFYLDGTVLPMLYHFGGLKSIYNSEALQSIDFYPGAFSTRYGGAIAGVIEIKGREAKKDRWHGQLDLNFIDGSVFFEGPVNKNVSLLVSARRSFIGDALSWYINNSSTDFPFSISPYYYDFLARTDINLSKNNKLFFTLLRSRDSLGIFMSSPQGGSSEMSENTNDLGTKIQFTTAIAGWDSRINSNLENSFRYSFTKSDFDMSVFGFAKVNEHPTLHHIRDELTWTANKAFKLSIGADVNLADENLILQLSSDNDLITRDTTNHWLFGVVGAYANAAIKPVEKLLIQPGIRYDYYPELIHDGSIVPEFWNYTSFNNERGISGDPSFRLSTRYTINSRHTIKAATGNYNQSPEPMGQVIHKTWGVPSTPTTKAVHYLLGYEWRITDLINADLQGYINRQWDLPRMASEEDQIEKPGVLWISNDKGKMRGLELLLRHEDNGKFFGWIAYTLSRSERWDPHANEYYLYGDDETHHVQLVASYHLPRNWDIGTRIRYVTGKPTTPIDSAYEDENISEFVAVPGAENSGRMDPFFQIDFRLDKKFVYKKWMFSAYLDIQNISWLFYKSPEEVVYDYDYDDKQPISMIILPALGIKAEF